MGFDIYFCYDADDKTQFEASEVACRGLHGLFEYAAAVEELRASVLYPPFVQDILKPEHQDSSDSDFMENTGEEGEEVLYGYIGPSFDPQELILWASTWAEILQEVNLESRRALSLVTTNDYDWTPVILEDLKEMMQQGECALLHGVKIHLEMY